jgi:hypothetical protein
MQHCFLLQMRHLKMSRKAAASPADREESMALDCNILNSHRRAGVQELSVAGAQILPAMMLGNTI